jgi:MFS family permease
VRALATGMAGVLAGLYLTRLRLTPAQVGVVIGAGLTGAALASLLATVAADRIGRRRFLILLALLSAAGGVAVALASTPLALAAAAFVGMLNGMGRDRGAALVLEQAALPATTTDAARTGVFARYNVLQDAGHALGSLLAGLPALLQRAGTVELPAYRSSVAVYAALFLAAVPLYLRLSPAIEIGSSGPSWRVSAGSRRILWRIGSLFALDSFAGGFITTAMLAVFFNQRFGVQAGTLAPLFFGARVANAASHLGAAWLARRIGLVNTMVFTHIPSSLLLVTVAYAPNFPVAALLLLLREGLVEMDVPTRQSYVMAVVRPEERTFASGLTHLVRMAGWAAAPAVGGLFMENVSLLTPLVVAAVMKVAYDVLLYVAFRRTSAPEESRRASPSPC